MFEPEDEAPEAPPLPDTWIHMARSGYNAPGEVPREEIWRAVEARLFPETPSAAPPPALRAARRRPWGGGMGLAAAAVVTLLMGVGLGRWSALRPDGAALADGAPVPGSAAPAAAPRGFTPSPAVRAATARHLSDAEALLSFVAADAREGRTDSQVGAWGRGLLTQTRLLLDSPVAGDPAIRQVLEDLEIVLAQVALLDDADADPVRLREELDLIARGMDEAGVRGRIRSVLPSVDRGLSAADD